MKKVVSLISALLLSLTLAACGNNASNPMQSALDTRQADLKAKFEDYIPEELTKINDARSAVKGDYVLFVIADAPEAAISAFEANASTAASAEELMQKVKESTSFVDEMLLLSAAKVSDLYMLSDKVTESCVYVSASGATAEELAIFKIKQ